MAQPSPKARSMEPVIDALGGAGEDDQGEDQGRHRSGDQRAGDDARDRNGPGPGAASTGSLAWDGGGVDAHGGLALAVWVVVHC